mgnify:FL=1
MSTQASTLDKSARFAFDRRSSGVLMHLTSLPGRHGSGDMGSEAFAFVDFLKKAGQTWWQMLPVNPPGEGWSPYSAWSTFAGSPWLISLDRLAEEGLLHRRDLAPDRTFRNDRVEFEAVAGYRRQRLRLAYERFKATRGAGGRLDRFIQKHESWIHDFALFSALRDAFAGKPWNRWSRDLKLREPQAVSDARRMLADEVRFHAFVQMQFDRQWADLRQYAHHVGVGLIGDIPIFVAYDSADVWAHRELFLLDREGEPKVVSGCPPDAFNARGQVWNHPHYDWSKHKATRFAWWVSRFAETFRLFDGVRIDHFLGFHRVWQVPAGREDAVIGKWARPPGRELFTRLRRALGPPPLIAEDLGLVTAAATKLRDDFGFPGMRVLQFAFGGGSEHLPHSQPRRSVLYTGTHDCDTVVGYFAKLAERARRRRGARVELRRMQRYVHTNGDGSDLHWDLIRAAMASHADTVIIPTQDLLGLGGGARMNVPGTTQDNWVWRMLPGQLKPEHAARLRQMTEDFERHPRSGGRP